MKKSILVLLAILVCASTSNFAIAKNTSNSTLASAIKMYRAGNYAQCYTTLTDLVKKDPSNAVAYYYLAITSTQIGKKDEAISNYEKVLELSPEGQIGLYAKKGKTCLESPEQCKDFTENSELDAFIQRKFGSGFSKEVRSDYEKQKIENLMREMNRGNSIEPAKFKEYKDFSSEVPTNDEIVSAIRVLQRAGLTDIVGNNSNFSDASMLLGSQDSDANVMMNMLMGNKNSAMSPQLIQSLITNQFSSGF